MLDKITEMAAALMSPDEIGCLLDLEDRLIYQMLNKKDSPLAIAFKKGRLKTKLELRKKIIQLAKAGSPQAELLADKYLSTN